MRAIHSLVTFGTHAIKGERGRFHFWESVFGNEAIPRDRIEHQQLAKLRIVLAHAGRTVPHWRRTFRRFGFEPAELSSLKDLEQLPILSRDTVRAHTSEMIADGFKRDDLVSLQTVGSTGRPLKLFIDRPSLERQMAIDLRVFYRVGIGPGTRLAKILPYGRSHDLANALVPFSGRIFLDATCADDEEMEHWYTLLKRHRIEAIYGHASCAYHFARYLQWFGYKLPDLRRVCVTGDRLTNEMRQVMSSVFESPIIDLYGRIETARLASECLRGRMHQELDAAVLEFVEDESVSPYKKILLTTLHNTAMPLIRYDLGDIAMPSKEPCPCGSRLPTIVVKPSKFDSFYELPDGHRVHTNFFTKPLHKTPDLEAFEIKAYRRRLV